MIRKYLQDEIRARGAVGYTAPELARKRRVQVAGLRRRLNALVRAGKLGVRSCGGELIYHA